jgi:hypothetical protein
VTACRPRWSLSLSLLSVVTLSPAMARLPRPRLLLLLSLLLLSTVTGSAAPGGLGARRALLAAEETTNAAMVNTTGTTSTTTTDGAAVEALPVAGEMVAETVVVDAVKQQRLYDTAACRDQRNKAGMSAFFVGGAR